ncbi:ModA ABC-type molybdate transport system, periplasmic component [Rhabdaerophilaceae bacterium]
MLASRRTLLAMSGIGLMPSARAQDARRPLLIFAAASFKHALDDIALLWQTVTGHAPPRLSYAASNALARQIERGAPADIFVSADTDWMDYLAAQNALRAGTRSNLASNRLVLIAPRVASAEITLLPGVDLLPALGTGRLAMAQIDAVPAGRYGKAALLQLGVWDSIRDKIAQTENVRAALLLVARGEASLGIVYATDAAVEPQVRILATFPEHLHPPILYPVAIVHASTNTQASAFLAFLKGEKAFAILMKYGFISLLAGGRAT